MSPTLFDAQAEKKRRQTRRLEEQLTELKQQAAAQSHQVTTMPAREERTKQHRRQPRDYSEVLRGTHGEPGRLAAYAPLPQNVKFETQQEQETILMVLRQHPVVNLRWILVAIILLLAPLVLVPLFPFFNFLTPRHWFFLNLGWLFLLTAYVSESFLSWYYNLYIITDERLIDVDFYSLIYRAISEAKLDKIEDVTATTTGVLGAIFDYGSISVQTAAEKREFELGNVPHPAKVTKFLNELIIEEEQEKIEGRAI